MTNRFFSVAARLVLLCLVGLLANGAVRAYPPHGPDAAPALIQVDLRDAADLDRLAASHLPVYARLTDAAGQAYALMLADSVERQELLDLGLAARVLDANTSDAAYYLAYRMPGRPAPQWNAFGRLLLDDGAQVLLRFPAGQAESAVEKLAQAGVRLSRVTFDPKPLYPSAQGALPAAITPDPLIQLMMSQVTTATVYAYAGGLSGEWPVQIGGAPYTITTRYTYSGQPIQKATQYVGEHLANLGLGVEYHQWSGATYPNVIGTLTGTLNPANIFIISAHLDDMPSSGRAPGADDNASGATAVLMAADILSQYNWGCTLRFAFWTGEEQGLLGSAAYAQRAYQRGENILGVLNLDMIAWNTPQSSPDIDLHAKSTLPQTLQLAQLFADVVDAYDLNLIPQIVSNGTGASDHASFWNYGYTAILGIEDYYPGGHDFNPYYHTSNDRLQYLDLAYFTDFVKASVGTFAHMSGCGPDYGWLAGQVTDAVNGSPLAGAQVGVTPANLYTFTASSGLYTFTLPAGVYDVAAAMTGYISQTASVVVHNGSTTVQNLALQPVPSIIVEPRALQAALDADEQLVQTVWLTSAGAAELTFTFYEIPPVPWLSETPTGGAVPAGQGVPVAVTFDSTGLPPGDYYAFLDIESNDPDAPHVYIPVTLTVELPCSPVHDAAFTWTPVTPTVGMQIDLVGVASGTAPIAFAWSLGDGAVSSGERITHTFAAPGDYTVVMTAGNCVSATTVVSHVITIGAPPIAAFAPAFYIAWPGQPVTFTNLSTGTPPLMHLWSFGDGAISTDTHPIHIYTTSDVYTVVLTVTNAYGRDVVTGTVEVVEPPCPVFTPAVTLTLLTGGPIYTDTPVLFEAVIMRDNALPYTFTVDYADGTLPETGAGVQDSFELTHTFAATGVHQVEIIVGLDRCGELALVTDTLAVTVSDKLSPCIRVAGVELSQVTPGPFYPGTPLTMTVSVTPPDAIPYHYTVDYGDGITATATGIESTLTLTHAFAAVQTCTVQVAVWNCSMTAPVTDTMEVTINPRLFNLTIYLPLVINE